MPFVYEPEFRCSESHNKRRKTSGTFSMARRQWEEDHTESHTSDDMQNEHSEAFEKSEAIQTSSREELIECIKNGKATIWLPNPSVQDMATHPPSPLQPERIEPTASMQEQEISDAAVPLVAPQSHLHPLAEVEDPIERPRSALHAGDFRQNAAITPQKNRRKESLDQFSTSPPPWTFSTPISTMGNLKINTKSLPTTQAAFVSRSRAPSLGSSLSSSFIMRVPTSPLINATTHANHEPLQTELEAPPTVSDKASRRRTLPPDSFVTLKNTSLEQSTPNFSRPYLSTQTNDENSLQSRGHNPRRSLNSFTYQPTPTHPIPPFLRSRRPSNSFEASPRASMVGSFEESILRGRMSAAPSKPIDFIAQIAVLGKGNCKPSLRFPAHAIVPFPAVFYNYSSTPYNKSLVDENPSPYVGVIDLEKHLKPAKTVTERRQRVLDSRSPEELIADLTAPENTAIGRALAREAKVRKPESLPKAPPGGCYRIPQEGQLQVIIKNPNKTAVKLYLVPYDLTGMEPRTKTFIRQRIYSAGPILEHPITANIQNQRKFDALQDKHILRYLIHLKICCPAKDRFYLYDNVRVVFANRVPDGKESLRIEMQVPQPRYSPYRPESSRSRSISESNVEGSNRRHSLKRGTPDSPQDIFDEVESLPLFISDESRPPLSPSATAFHSPPGQQITMIGNESAQLFRLRDAPPVPQLPFQYRAISTTQTVDRGRAISPTQGFQPSTSTRSSPVPWLNDASSRSFSPLPLESGNGLLSRKLRERELNEQEIYQVGKQD